MAKKISGSASAKPSPAEKAVSEFMAIVFKNMKPRRKTLPDVSDESLKRLTRPLLAILAGKDVFVDSQRARVKLERNVAKSRICLLPDSHHSITNQTQPILEFLRAVHEV
jgi:esterase/lipase